MPREMSLTHCMDGRKTGGSNLSTWRRTGRSEWARADEMEAQRGARPKPWRCVLQKALRPEPRDWVNHWRSFPPENPAGHRKANCCIAQMHHPHKTPPSRDRFLIVRGGTTTDSIGTITTPHHASKAQPCYGSGTEVIGVIRTVNKEAGKRTRLAITD